MQTDAIPEPVVAPPEPVVVVVPRYLRADPIAKVYVTEAGGKYHKVKACAESRTKHIVREFERCLVCAA